MANKRYDTYGYTPDGKRVDVYVENGQTYLRDGTRLPSGYTVQTQGGIYKMGDGGGYGVNAHNVPSLSNNFTQNNMQDIFNNLFKFSSDKDYGKLGSDMYKPVYDAKSDAIRNRLNLDTQMLNTNIGKTNRMYDQYVQQQHDMNEQAKNEYSNQTLNRGLGRSTIATTGMAGMDVANQKQVASLNESRALALQDLHGRIQALTENANQELSTLDSNRAIEERNLAWQLEDRDRQHWLQEAQLNAPLMMNAQQRQWDLEDRDYSNAMEQYNYDMGLERALAGHRGGTPENTLSNKEWQREMSRNAEKVEQEFDLWAENELKRYTPGTNAYKVKQAEIAEAKEMLRYQMSLSGGGRGYGGYGSSSSKSPYKGADYDMYDGFKQVTDYINYMSNQNGVHGYQQGLDELQKLKYSMANDPRFQTQTTPAMRNKIMKELNNTENYYKNKIKYGANWEYPQQGNNVQKQLQKDFPLSNNSKQKAIKKRVPSGRGSSGNTLYSLN